MQTHLKDAPKTPSLIHRAEDAPLQAEETQTLAQSSQIKIYECIRALCSAGIEPTRELIQQRTGLPLTTVDDRIKLLRQEGLISTRPQCYRPTVQFAQSRPVSTTTLPEGETKIEVGDEMMTLTPQEARQLGLQLQGAALEATALAKQSLLTDMLTDATTELRILKRQLQAAVMGRDPGGMF